MYWHSYPQTAVQQRPVLRLQQPRCGAPSANGGRPEGTKTLPQRRLGYRPTFVQHQADVVEEGHRVSSWQEGVEDSIALAVRRVLLDRGTMEDTLGNVWIRSEEESGCKNVRFLYWCSGSFRQHTNLSLSKKKNCISSLSHLQTLVSPVSLASTEHVMHALIGWRHKIHARSGAMHWLRQHSSAESRWVFYSGLVVFKTEKIQRLFQYLFSNTFRRPSIAKLRELAPKIAKWFC